MQRPGAPDSLLLLPPAHGLAAVLPAVDDVDPAAETRGRARAAGPRERVGETQVGEFDRGPIAAGRQTRRTNTRDRLLAQVADHGPRTPVEIDPSQERALG